MLKVMNGKTDAGKSVMESGGEVKKRGCGCGCGGGGRVCG